MLHVKKASIVRAAMACGLLAVSVGIAAAPGADADLNLVAAGNQLVECTGTEIVATLNPTIKDGSGGSHDARYVKASAKASDGTKTFLGGVPVPADNTTCSIDAGIRTNQGAQDVKYVLDDQTGGNATLNALTSKPIAGTLTGSTQCDSSQTGPETMYPNAYPLQGKLIVKFIELNAGKPIQQQGYIRTYADPADPGVFHVTGTVIKGPGLGGRLTTAFSFLPTDSVKNINVVTGCTNGIAGDAVGAELYILSADSSLDADASPEGIQVTISDDQASENLPLP
jgi:hypothetical protein